MRPPRAPSPVGLPAEQRAALRAERRELGLPPRPEYGDPIGDGAADAGAGGDAREAERQLTGLDDDGDMSARIRRARRALQGAGED